MAEPYIGLRVMRVGEWKPGQYYLSSQIFDRVPWLRPESSIARCQGRPSGIGVNWRSPFTPGATIGSELADMHRPPGLGCTCGWYLSSFAIINGVLSPALSAHNLLVKLGSNEPSVMVVAMALGDVVIHEFGARAERLRLMAMISGTCGIAPAQVMSAFYQIPIIPSGTARRWASEFGTVL